MNETTRESKFLDAINQYAEAQKKRISAEVEDYKARRIEQATEEGLKDAYVLIQKDVAQKKSEIVSDASAKQRALRNELFALRSEMMRDVFTQAAEKLLAYTKTVDYKVSLAASAERIKNRFDNAPVTVFLSPADRDKSALIQKAFQNVEILFDESIRIGGIKALSREHGIMADDTLDSKLDLQKTWFIENSGLKVV